MPLDFTSWLLNTPHRLAIQDLADDARRDRNWPLEGDRDRYLCYLVHHGACPEAIEACKRAWRAWEKYIDRLGPPA